MEELSDRSDAVSQLPALNAWDRALIAHYLHFYLDLESGRRRPTTAAQRHFVLVAHSRARPSTQHEIAFTRYRRSRPHEATAEPEATPNEEANPTGHDRCNFVLVRDDDDVSAEAPSPPPIDLWPDQHTIDSVDAIENALFYAAGRSARTALNRIRSLYRRGMVHANGTASDRIAWIGALLSDPELAHSMERWFSDSYGGLSNVYTKAMDGEGWLKGLVAGDEYVSPWLHRLFEGHSLPAAWSAVRDAVPNDDTATEIVNFVKAIGSDLVTVVGLPLTQLTPEQYGQLKDIVADRLGIPEQWLIDILHYNAQELVAAAIPGLAVALNWKRGDAVAFAKLAGSLGIGGIVAANPIMAILSLAVLARAFH